MEKTDTIYTIYTMMIPAIHDDALEVYYRIQGQLEKKFAPDDYVVIHPQSGKYFIAKTSVDAMKKARSVYPKGKLFLAQIGRVAGFMK